MKNTAMIVIVSTFILAGCTKSEPTVMFSQPDGSTQVAVPSTQPTDLPEITPPHIVSSPSASPLRQAQGKQTPKPALSVTQLPSTYKSDEARDIKSVDTVIVHTLYNPKYPDDLSITHAKDVLDDSEVSSHFVIARDGKIYQLVPENYQAWQAGVSQMPAPDKRTGVNAFSLGIELIATEDSGITQSQYDSLTNLVIDISKRLPIKNILGHSDIAPGRKTDPWKFDWVTWQRALSAQSSTSFVFYH